MFCSLDDEGGRVKLRASGEDSLRVAEACKALPRAGFEAQPIPQSTGKLPCHVGYE
jgi:hypothetical protein